MRISLPRAVTYYLNNVIFITFLSKTAVFCERIQFYELKQTKNESIDEWYVCIKKGAKQCNFANFKDKFVTGLVRGSTLDRLCEVEPDRTLTELVEITRKRDASTTQIAKCQFP